MDTLFEGSTGILSCTVQDRTGNPVEDAEVTVVISTSEGDPVVGEAWPAAVTGVGGGVYEYVVSAALLQPRRSYAARVVAVKGAWQRTAVKVFRVDQDRT